MKHFGVVVNDCAAIAVTGGPVHVRSQTTAHGLQNFVLGFDHVAAGLSRQLTNRELDWIETAGHVFAVDLACRREDGDLNWMRSIDAHLPVRDPHYWATQAKRISDVISDFTGDRFTVTFHPATDPNPPPRQHRKSFAPHDRVALLSGGVDSFVGAARLLDDSSRPLFVSHTAAGAIAHAQAEAMQALSRVGDAGERVTITAQKRGDFPDPEPSQRSRSFLFLAAALVVAAVDGSHSVFINENGVMALHLPLTTARIGSLSTHTASPSIMDRVVAIAQDVLDAPVTIGNNLIALTKPEVVAAATSYGVASDLCATVSCWSIGRTSEHCGVCVPCIIRRISFEAHAVADAKYTADVFEDASVLANQAAIDNLTHLVRHVDELTRLTDLDLQISFPELLNGSTALPLAEAIDLHRRWGRQAEAVLSSHSVPRSIW